MFIPSAGCSQLTTFALPEVLLSPGTTCPVCNGQQTALFSSCPAVYSHELQSTLAAALTGHLQLVTTVLGGTKKGSEAVCETSCPPLLKTASTVEPVRWLSQDAARGDRARGPDVIGTAVEDSYGGGGADHV